MNKGSQKLITYEKKKIGQNLRTLITTWGAYKTEKPETKITVATQTIPQTRAQTVVVEALTATTAYFAVLPTSSIHEKSGFEAFDQDSLENESRVK